MSKVTVKIIGHIGHEHEGKLYRPGESFETTQGHADGLLKRFPGMYEITKEEKDAPKSYIPKKEVDNG